jgi:aspartate racemase
VDILASPAVRKVGLFDARLAEHGLSALYADDEPAMLAAIRLIKAQGPQPLARQALRTASEDLRHRGAAVQMIACTEFSLIADALGENITAFDTLDVLVGAILDFALHGSAGQKKAAE